MRSHNNAPAAPRAGNGTVIVYLTGALGDLVLATPTLALVRSVHRRACLHGIVPPALSELYPALFDSATGVDSAAVADLFGSHARHALHAHPVWRDVNKAILFEPATGAMARALAKESTIELFCVDATPGRCPHEHYARWIWRRTAELLGESAEFTVVAPHDREPAVPPREPFGLVHPGSGSALKNCPGQRLAAACREFDCAQLLALEGESDGGAVAEFIEAWAGPATILPAPPLAELAWYLKHAAFYVGNDSGVSQLAGTCGSRGIVFFGRTDPHVWQPLGTHLEIRRFV